jgi:hypothetical protein
MRDVHALLILRLLAVLLVMAPAFGRGASGEPAKGWPLEPFTASAEGVLEAALAVPVEDDADVVVLLKEQRYLYDSEGREESVRTLVYRLLTQDGIESSWGRSECRWEPWHQERPQLQARVIAPDGSVYTLDPATLSEDPAEAGGPSVFDDRRIVHAPLPALAKGVVVEERVTVRETEAMFPGGSLHRFYPRRKSPVHDSRLIVEVPHGTKLLYETPLLTVEPEMTRDRQASRWSFRFLDVEPGEDPEPYLPPEVARYPHVIFTTGDSWQRLAERYAAFVDKQIAVSDLSEIAQPVKELDGDPTARITAVLELVRSTTRYAGLEFGEASIVPRPPHRVLELGYGDCKDQATLVVALLRQVGVPANVALLASGHGQDLDPDLPSLAALNHAIVHVPGDPPLWIDPTERYARLGQLPLADHGRLALIADPKTTGVVLIPPAEAAFNGEIETRVFELADLHEARFTSTTEPQGSSETTYRYVFDRESAEELRKMLEDWLKSAFLADALTDLRYSDPQDLGQPFTLTVSAAKVQRGFTTMDEAQVAIPLRPMLSRFPDSLLADDEKEDDEERTPSARDNGRAAADASEGGETDRTQGREHDFVFSSPFTVEWRYRIVPPLGFAAEQLPESKTTPIAEATLDESFSLAEDGVVSAVLRCDSGPTRISPADVATMRTVLAELAEREPITIRFVHSGQTHLAAGRVREGLRELVTLIERSPQTALHYVRLSRGLLATGFGERAREVARTAVEVDPNSLLAHTTLAWVLQHDAIGRRFGPGFDLAGALAAYRAALALDDSSSEARIAYAILLEHNADGDRYGRGADLEAAIEQYQKVLEEDGNNDQARQNLNLDRLYQGSYEAIKASVTDLGSVTELDDIVFAAIALSDGPDATVRTIKKHYYAAAERRERYAQCADQLFRLRHYPEAAEMYRLAAQGASDAASLLSLADNVAATKRREEITTDMSTPQGVVVEIIRRLTTESRSTGCLAELMSPAAMAELDADAFGNLEGGMGRSLRMRLQMKSHRRFLTKTSAATLDLGLANVELHTEGETGEAVRVNVSGDRSSFFLMPSDGTYRLMGTEYTPELLGAAVHAFTEAGKLGVARQILDWAWDDRRGLRSIDPFDRPLFPKIWTKGAEPDERTIRQAAIILMIDGAHQGTHPERCVKPLAEWISTKETGNHQRRDLFRFALITAADMMGDTDTVVRLARELLVDYPGSETLFPMLSDGLITLGRVDEAREVAEKALVQGVNRRSALRALARVAEEEGKLDEADGWLERILESTDALPMDYTHRAWLAIFRNAADESALAWTHRAIEDYIVPMPDDLHTLAALYAERDMPAEAYQVLLQAIDASMSDQPQGIDWYVLGRMAESLGFLDNAATYYQRVDRPKEGDSDALSAYALSQRRLSALAQRNPDAQ